MFASWSSSEHARMIGSEEPFEAARRVGEGRSVAASSPGPTRGGGAEQPLHAGREDASGLFLEHAVERAREQFRVVGKAVRRQRWRHVEASHGLTKATKPCLRRRCRWWTRR